MPSAQINQPSNQIRLTNISLIRLKRNKTRYELACYKNTLLAYRTNPATYPDLDDVLQIPQIFLNVSKGQTAPNKDLTRDFPGLSRDEVVKEILQKGEVQVGDKERGQELERVWREVVEMVQERVVDPRSGRVYTTGIIGKALEELQGQQQGGRSAGGGRKGEEGSSASRERSSGGEKKEGGGEGEGYEAAERPVPRWKGVTTTKSAKSQALDAIKALVAHQPIPVARARMRLRITCPNSILKQTAKAPQQQQAPVSDSKTSEEPSNNNKKGGKKGGGKGGKKGKSHDEDDLDPSQPLEKVEKLTVKETLLSFIEQVESEDVGSGDTDWEVVGFVEPGSFKGLGEFVSAQTKGRARVEVLDMAVVHEGGE